MSDVVDEPLPAKRLDASPARFPVGAPTSLATSALWSLQRAYYERRGLQAWGAGGVPHHITCNPVIANGYAEVLVAFLHDLDAASALDRSRRFPVLEIGSGSGRFAYLLLRRLRQLLAADPVLRDVELTLVLSDFDPAKLEQLAEHPRFAEPLESGWLDLATVDASAPGPIRTWRSGIEVGGGPLAVIANYVFDSLPAEAYAVQGGVVHEASLQVLADAPDLDLLADGAMARLSFEWTLGEPVAPSRDTTLDGILARHAAALGTTSVLVPTTALALLDHLVAAAGAPVLALVADKGWAHQRDLFGQDWPAIVPHEGCFSVMVDFDALAHVVRSRGGTALLPDHRPGHLAVAALALTDVPVPLTADRYDDRLGDGGPDDHFDVRGSTVPAGPRTLTQALSALRSSRHDVQVFLELLPSLLELANGLAGPQRTDLAIALRKVHEGWFDIGDPADVALCLGLVHAAMGRHRDALALIQESIDGRGTGESHLAAALAHHALGELELSRKKVRDALEVEPGLDQARALLVELEDELAVDA